MLRFLVIIALLGLTSFFAFSQQYEPPILTGELNPLGLTAKEQREYHLNQSCAPVPGRYTQGCLIIK